jgi:hypothetical protein
MNNIPTADPICDVTKLNPAFFPMGSAVTDPNFNILPFLCNLLQHATDESIDPVLIPPTPYDISPHINFTALTAIGDHRFSDGDLLNIAFANFLPKLVTQVEVKQAGGTQIINNYICDSDGNPIKQSQVAPILTTVGNGNINLFGYNIPPIADANELLKPFKAEDVLAVINNAIISGSNRDADAFCEYLQLYYPKDQWNAKLFAFPRPQFFYVELDYAKDSSIAIYLKYHPEMQSYVAKKLASAGYIASDAEVIIKNNTLFANNALARIFLEPIANYVTLVNNSTLAVQHQMSAVDIFSAKPNEQYVNMVNSSISGLSGITTQSLNTVTTYFNS